MTAQAAHEFLAARSHDGVGDGVGALVPTPVALARGKCFRWPIIRHNGNLMGAVDAGL